MLIKIVKRNILFLRKNQIKNVQKILDTAAAAGFASCFCM